MKRYILALFAVAFFLASCGEKEQEVAVTSVTITQATAEMLIGETVQLTATVLPSNASENTIRWVSSNQSVASVSNSGLVTALAEGTSTVTASCGGKSATCQVTVSKGFVEVTSVSLNKEELSLIKGHEETLTATVKPDDATDKTVTWSSSTSSVATVDQNGKVKAVSGGNAIITAKAGNLQATCSVTVTVPVESISLDQESITLEEEQSVSLLATVKPDDATDKTVTWSSSENQIATVDESGKVTAVKEGSANITAKAGDKTATCSITVKKKYIAVSSVTLNQTELALIKGKSETLTATVKPDDATDKKVIWSSSNASIATVDQNGKVTAVAGGSATITAKAEDKQATCTVTVTVPVSSLTLNKSELALIKGQSETLTATVKPDDATDKKVTWSSSNTSIATVDQNGKVTAVGGGSAIITAKVGDKQATCSVTVTVPVSSITLNKSEITLFTGESETLKVTVKPDDATDKTVTWTSSNTGVATVNGGVVFAMSVGRTTITASVGNQSASCSVVVYQSGSYIDEYGVNRGQGITISGITWAPVNCGYKEASGGNKGYIYGKLYQWGRRNGQGYGKPYYNSSDTYEDESIPNIASTWTGNNEDADVNTFYYGLPDQYNWINQNTSFWNDGTESMPVKNEVYDPCPKGWRVPTVSELSTLAYGYRSDLVTNNGVYGFWYSGNSLYSESLTNKVFLPASGDRFADNWFHGCGALARGSSGAYWSSSLYGGSAYNYDINGSLGTTYKAFGMAVRCCKDEVVQIVPVSSLSFTQGFVSVDKGKQLQLSVVIQPNNATCKAVLWSSSNTSVATVDQNGKVSAIGAGSVVITVTTKDGSKTATCNVTVVIPVNSVSLNKTDLTIEKGKSMTLTATVNPSDATDKTVTWKSSNTSIATVDQNGKVTAVNLGNAVITVTTKDGSKTATCSVTVKRPANTEPIGDDGGEHGWD